MLNRRLAGFLLFNVTFLVVNFYLWTYNPGEDDVILREVAAVNGGGRVVQLPADVFQQEYVEEGYVDVTSRPGKLNISASERRFQRRKSPSGLEYDTEDAADYDANMQEEIVWAWKRKRANASISHVPETDVYHTPAQPIRTKYSHPKFARLRKSYRVPKIKYTDLVNCAKLLRNDSAEIKLAQDLVASREFTKVPIADEQYLEMTRDCDDFRRKRGYVTVPLTREEEEFPLAFSIAMYTDVEQTERLLRAIYQPQNYYCIHVDTKSPLLLHRTVRSIARCFDNVWVASHLDKIKWGDVSVLLPAVNCMRDMVRFHRGRWKYFINLAGQEFPLRTNYELVQIAKIFNGSNDIAGSIPRMEMARVQYKWAHRWSRTYQQTIFFQTTTPHSPPPFNLTFFKGELHGLFARKMVEFIVESEYGTRYLDWCWDTGHPSEHYWNVLNYNSHLGAPGGYQGPLDVAAAYSFHPAIRAKNWDGLYGDRKCHGKFVRGICVYGIADAPWLATRKELFANKFHLTYEYLGYDCLEELHRNRTMMKDNIPFFDKDYYESLPTVRYSRKDGL